MPPELRIQLFGQLTLLRDGQPVPASAWRSRQERRLLAILLTARGGWLPAERLIEWLWPGADRETAAVTLRAAVSSLRRTLEPGRSGRASARYILTRSGSYTWNDESGASIDVDEFLACLAPTADDGAGAASLAHRPAPIDRLERALALYRGDYLEDEPDAPWASATRSALRTRYLHTVELLAEERTARGEYDDAVLVAQRGLARDPLHEPLYRALMRAQALAGDTAGALQSFERYRRALDQELGAVPAPQTQALHAAILRGELGSREHAGPHSPTAPPPPAALLPARPLARSPLVGRDAELEALRGWLGQLRERRGGVVTIVGEAGIGKTRLIAEALQEAAQRGFQAIAIRGALLDRDLPFASLGEALRPLVQHAPEAVLRRLPRTALAQAAELLPALRERVPGLPELPALPPDERRSRIIGGLVELAQAIASTTPLVIACDDAQWADEALLATIARLARYVSRHALLVIVAYRSEELVENAALHALLRSLGREMLLRPLVLGRLGDPEIAALLAGLPGLAGAAPEQIAALARRLAARSGGNPLFLSVILQSLIEDHGATSLAALLGGASPVALPDPAEAPPIRDLVIGRLERLPEPARALLDQLAVIGRPVSLDLIEQLADGAALDAAQALLDRGLLSEEPGGAIGFTHDLVRSIVLAAIGPARRRRLHRQAARALAALHAHQPERTAELALHFGQAGRGAEPEILRYAAAAGDYARRAFAYREAIRLYNAALQAAERLGPAADAPVARGAFAGRVLAYEALLDWDGIADTVARFDRWAALRPASPEGPLLGPGRLLLLQALAGDLAGAALSATRAERQGAAPAAIRDMLHRTALILRPALPAEAGAARPGEWPPFAPAAPPPGSPATELPALLGAEEAAPALFQIGWAALMQGLLGDAQPCLAAAYRLALETGQLAAAVAAALQLAHFAALRGEQMGVAQWLDVSLGLARRSPEAGWAAIWPSIHQAFLLLVDDRLEAAGERFSAIAAQLSGLPAFQSHRASVEAGLGLLALAQGEHAEAARRLGAALASAQLRYGFVYVAAQHGVARLAALRGDLAEARALLGHTLEYSAARGLLPEYARSAVEVARIERDFGEPSPALPLLRAASALASDAGLAPLAAAARTLLARLSA